MRLRDVLMVERAPAGAVVALGLLMTAPTVAAATRSGFRPAIVAEGLPKQCVVPPQIHRMPAVWAVPLLLQLGCRVHVAQRPSPIRRGLVIGVVGGARSYRYRHRVTLVVSSGS